MKNIWFKAKEYGWGWYPVNWQGWVVTLVFSLVLGFRVASFVTKESRLPESIVLFLAEIVLIVGVLVVICFKKGEKPSWRWGSKS